MSLYVNTNSEALIAQNNLNTTETNLSTATTDLSSGLRINTAADDAAGYAIAQDLTSQVNGLSQATNNAQDATSLIQTADGSLNSVNQILQRISELAVEANGGTLSTTDEADIKDEVTALTSEITQIGTQSQFNGISLFGGSSLSFQIGTGFSETISVTLSTLGTIMGSGMISNILGAFGGTGVSSVGISDISAAIDNISTAAADLGAVQNRLSYSLDNLSTYSENLTSAQSTIQDVDMASEETTFTQEQVLEQAGISMLSQAEQQPQMVLKLLQG